MISMEALRARIAAAHDGAAELVIRNARVVNVFTREILGGDVALLGDTVIGVGGRYDCERVYDAGGAYLAPGLIDAHLHIESSMVTPASFASVILPHGTTTIIADPHEIANVCGTAGIEAIYRLSEGLPLDVRFMLPSCVPATPFEHNGAALKAEDLLPFLAYERVLGLGEVMDYVSLTGGEESMLEKLRQFSHTMIDGHAPLITGRTLNAYCVGGPQTDHECSNYDEVMEKLRAGMRVILRMGSAAHGVRDILARLAQERVPTDRVLFCTDDKHIETIRQEGHINHILATAVACGIDPLEAVRMATLNTATAYGLKGLGGIAPGYRANLVLFEDLKAFRVRAVFTNGVEYQGGPIASPPVPDGMRNSVNAAPLHASSLRLITGETAPVIQMVPEQLVTELVTLPVRRENGAFLPGDGLNKLAVIERHHARGTVGLGIVKGLHIRGGAIGSTVAHDSHNIVVAGDNDADMLLAVETLRQQGGGYVAVGNGRVLANLPLPVAGLMSDAPVDEVLAAQQALLAAAHDTLGVPAGCDPLTSLSFLALPVIPAARLTDMGLFDVVNARFI